MRRYLIIGLAMAMLSLAGCGKQQEPGSSVTVKLGDTTLKVPCKTAELEKTGYKLVKSDFPEVSYNMECVGYYTDEEGRNIVVSFGTKEADPIPIEDAMIIDVLADDLNTRESNLMVHGDIGLGSTEEEVQKVYGEPAYSMDGESLYIMNHTNINRTYVATQDGKVCRVEVMMAEGYLE